MNIQFSRHTFALPIFAVVTVSIFGSLAQAQPWPAAKPSIVIARQVRQPVLRPWLGAAPPPPPPAPILTHHPRQRVGWTYVPGYWRWTGMDYVWVDETWVIARPGVRYVAPHWIRVPGGWQFVEAGWIR